MLQFLGGAKAGLRIARRAKERTSPELLAPQSRCRLVVIALDVGGRWSAEAVDLVRQLARARARSVPERLRSVLTVAYVRRWCSLFAAAASRAYAASLLAAPVQSTANVDGAPPLVRMLSRRSTCCAAARPAVALLPSGALVHLPSVPRSFGALHLPPAPLTTGHSPA